MAIATPGLSRLSHSEKLQSPFRLLPLFKLSGHIGNIGDQYLDDIFFFFLEIGKTGDFCNLLGIKSVSVQTLKIALNILDS